jgi:glucose-1-phosphate thymidylyltransferase
MKGIILAGGLGTRLYPITHAVNKQLMPIYDKPMIYYPLSTLMTAGIREILIITNPEQDTFFRNLLGDGSQLGCKFEYATQDKPRGLPDAYIIGEKFIGDDSVCMVLGDNIFYGADLGKRLKFHTNPDGAVVFGYHVSDPHRYGIIEFDENNNVLSVEEKPSHPKSNYAQIGIYFTDNRIIEIAKSLTPSARGELEIPHAMEKYRELGKLKAEKLDQGYAWLDTGTFNSMMQASQFVQIIEERQGLKIGCIEEVAYKEGFIDKNQLEALATPLLKSGYGDYLMSLIH